MLYRWQRTRKRPDTGQECSSNRRHLSECDCEFRARQRLCPRGSVDQSTYQVALQSAEANYQQALAARDNAKINFDRTIVYAPVNGYVTNLVLDLGDYADIGKAVLAVVDSDSFRVEAYLEETKLNFVKVGDTATVIPMSGAPPIKGQVDSIARGIGDTQNPTGTNLLQDVNATFEWVRLAQRIPVRIKLIDVPKETILSSGMTVTVSIVPRRQSEGSISLGSPKVTQTTPD